MEHTDFGGNTNVNTEITNVMLIQILSNEAKHFTKVFTSSQNNPNTYNSIMI